MEENPPKITLKRDIEHRAATVGMFDGVHLGHRTVLKRLCDIAADRNLTPTVFTFDRHPLEVVDPDRAPMKITTPAQRADAFVDCGVHDVFIMVFNDHLRTLSAEDFLEMLHHDYGVELLLLGYNHRFGHDSAHTFDEYCQMGLRHGIVVERADEFRDTDLSISSSVIRDMLAKGNIEGANRLLGEPFTLRGKVVRGRGIGRSIGFPTANVLPLMSRQMLPAEGVYAAIALLPGGRRRRAMVNIGTNPTVNDDGRIRVEAHLLDFNEDLYGSPVALQFYKRLRDEQRFGDLDELRAHIAADRADTIKAIPDIAP